jgi:GNAT superfamily N-acetyltransferase
VSAAPNADLVIGPLSPGDRGEWGLLARGYKAFYRAEVTPAEYDQAWRRLIGEEGVFGLAARTEGRLAGIAHYLFHTSVWVPKVCYLQDLFVLPEARGRGVARALIEAVARAAREAQAERCYWLTQEDNKVARALYDKVAKFNGFLRYDVVL